jgi:hypothetical protein
LADPKIQTHHRRNTGGIPKRPATEINREIQGYNYSIRIPKGAARSISRKPAARAPSASPADTTCAWPFGCKHCFQVGVPRIHLPGEVGHSPPVAQITAIVGLREKPGRERLITAPVPVIVHCMPRLMSRVTMQT